MTSTQEEERLAELKDNLNNCQLDNAWYSLDGWKYAGLAMLGSIVLPLPWAKKKVAVIALPIIGSGLDAYALSKKCASEKEMLQEALRNVKR